MNANSAELAAYLDELKPKPEIRVLFDRYGLRFRWLAVIATMIASIATILSATIINVAIPNIMGAYGIDQDQAQWLATANLAAATVGMLLSDWANKAIGLRMTVLIAMSMFLASCVLGGMAPNLEVMIFARILQGIPAGVIAPISMSVIFQVFPPGKQGQAMGLASIGVVLAPAVGPAIGGVLVDEISWRAVFLMGVPFSVVCLPLCAMFMPERDEEQQAPPFDWTGLTLITVAITVLLVALTNGQKEGWSSDLILSYFAITLVCGAAFIWWENHFDHPILDLRVFKDAQFTIIAVTAFMFGAGIYGSTYVIPLFLQMIQGLTPTQSGVLLIPGGIMMALAFPLSGRLADKMDIRIVVSAGIIIFAYSFYLLTDADEYTAFWVLTMIVVLGRFGIGLVMPPLNVAALKNLPPELLHQGSGAYNFLRQLGGAFGVNLLAVLLQLRTDYHYDSLSATQRFDNSTTQSMLYEVKQVLAQQGLTFVEQNYLATQYLAQLIYKQALTLGFKDSFWAVVVSFMVIMLPILAIRDKSPATSSSPASQTQSSDDDAPPAMPDPDDPAPHTARS